MAYQREFQSSVWNELEQLQREMNKWMNTAFSERFLASTSFPALNIWASDDSQVIAAELPGVNVDDIEINVIGDSLTIKGERLLANLPENAQPHRQERFSGKFSRSLQLPFQVDAEKIEARYENGILTIKLPRAEADLPKRIKVNAD